MRDEITGFFKDAFTLKYDTIPNREIKKVIFAGTKVKGTNISVLLISIVIACVGLNTNSIPIVIGAMLISPLMTGIMAIGYGYASSDGKLLSNALINLLVEVVLCILTSYLYFFISPIQSSTPELLARTAPTFYDVLIAVFGGLAGIIGLTRQDSDKGNVVPGVAIATALIPPLCTAGYGLATMQLRYFYGAIYLFLINSFFIVITTYIFSKVMKLSVHDIIEDSADGSFSVVFIVIAVVVIVFPTIAFTYTLINESMVNSSAGNFIRSEFNFDETQVIDSEIDVAGRTMEVFVVGKPLTQSEITELNLSKDEYPRLSDMELRIYQNEVIDSVTEAELEEILNKYSLDLESVIEENQLANSIELELKVQKIEELENNIDLLESQIDELKTTVSGLGDADDNETDILDLLSELQVLEGRITGLRLEKSLDISDNLEVSETYVAHLGVSELIPEEELTAVREFLSGKLLNTDVTVVQSLR